MADEFVDQAADYYQRRLGLEPHQARGAARYMFRNESAGKPDAVNPSSGALGIAQWLGPRKSQLIAKYGDTPSLDQQLDFSVGELVGPERKTLDRLRTAKTEGEAYGVWGQQYERPGAPALAKAGVHGDPLGLSRAPAPLDQAIGGGARQPPPHIAAMLDALVGGKPAAEEEPHPKAMLDTLIDQVRPAPLKFLDQLLATGDTNADRPAPLKFLDRLIGMGDPEAKGAAEASRAMEPVVGGAAKAIAGDVADIGKSVIETAELPGKALKGEIEPGSPEGKSAATDFALTFLTPGGPKVGGLASGVRWSARFTDEQLRKMYPDALKGGVIHKGDRIEDLRKVLDEMGPRMEQRSAHGGGAAQQQTGVPPKPPGFAGTDAEWEAETRRQYQESLRASEPPPPGPPGPPKPVGGSGPAEPFPSPPTVSTARADTGPVIDPRRAGEGPRDTADRIADGLHRLRTRATANQLEAQNFARTLHRESPELTNEKFQEGVYHDTERRLIDPLTPLAPETEAFLTDPRIVEWTSRQSDVANWLKDHLSPADAEAADLPGALEGYVHRIHKGTQNYYGTMDPKRGQANVITGGAPGLRAKTLSRQASGVQPRTRFVMQQIDEDGNIAGKRIFAKTTLDEMRQRLKLDRLEYGDELPIRKSAGPADKPLKWRILQPTTAEIEAGVPGAEFHKNFLANTIDNVMRLERVRDNVRFLDGIKPELEGFDLFVPEGSKKRVGEGMERVDLPQLRGWASRPVAHALNDFYNASKGDLDGFLRKANRAMVGSLFITPIPHALNVGAHWVIGRGWDWINVPEYANQMKAASRALRAVRTFNEDYRAVMREGGSLLRGDVATDNFYGVMVEKLLQSMKTIEPQWGDVARLAGHPNVAALRDAVEKIVKAPVRAARAEYKWSRDMLWASNDFFMLQRVFELEGKGMPRRQAIFQAEKDIPNYRIPSEIMGSRAMAEFLGNPNIINFGRYRHGQLSALGHIVTDLAGPEARARLRGATQRGGIPPRQLESRYELPDKQRRIDAATKLIVLGGLGLFAFPYAQDWLRKAVDNPKASLPTPGPFSVLAAGGSLARQAASNLGIYKKSPEEESFGQAMASFLTLAPTARMTAEVLGGGRDNFGRPIIEDQALPLSSVVQGGEFAGSGFYPLQMGITASQPGGVPQMLGRLGSVSIPRQTSPAGREAQRDEDMQKKAQGKLERGMMIPKLPGAQVTREQRFRQQDRGRAYSRSEHDPIERGVRKLLRRPLPSHREFLDRD